jgi:hypothetical protein
MTNSNITLSASGTRAAERLIRFSRLDIPELVGDDDLAEWVNRATVIASMTSAIFSMNPPGRRPGENGHAHIHADEPTHMIAALNTRGRGDFGLHGSGPKYNFRVPLIGSVSVASSSSHAYRRGYANYQPSARLISPVEGGDTQIYGPQVGESSDSTTVEVGSRIVALAMQQFASDLAAYITGPGGEMATRLRYPPCYPD